MKKIVLKAKLIFYTFLIPSYVCCLLHECKIAAITLAEEVTESLRGHLEKFSIFQLQKLNSYGEP